MTEERELLIPFNEFCRLVIKCKCGVEIVLDVSKKDKMEASWKEKGLACPVCHNEFDSQLRNGLYSFTHWLECIQNSGEKVSFRIKRTN